MNDNFIEYSNPKMTTTTEPVKQVNLMCSYVCMTKFNSAMFQVISIPDKYQDNTYLNQKLKDYENSQYLYINSKKLNGLSLETNRKYKVYLLFEDFTSKKDDTYVLYYKQVLIKDKGQLEERTFNSGICLSDSE